MAALQEIIPTAVEIHVITVACSVSFIISSNLSLLFHLSLMPPCQRTLTMQMAVQQVSLAPAKTSDTLDAMTKFDV
jgi:hypothetical protein